MVECTGLENQQSRKALVGSNPTASAMDHTARAVCAAAFLILGACTSIPGETTISSRQQREVRDRLLAMARSSDASCRDPRVSNTEVLDVHSDGRSAEELWTVEQCGRRLRYVVSFPVKPGRVSSFSAREER